MTRLDAFKLGGESTLEISGCKFSGSESDSGLILGDFLEECTLELATLTFTVVHA